MRVKFRKDFLDELLSHVKSSETVVLIDEFTEVGKSHSFSATRSFNE